MRTSILVQRMIALALCCSCFAACVSTGGTSYSKNVSELYMGVSTETLTEQVVEYNGDTTHSTGGAVFFNIGYSSTIPVYALSRNSTIAIRPGIEATLPLSISGNGQILDWPILAVPLFALIGIGPGTNAKHRGEFGAALGVGPVAELCIGGSDRATEDIKVQLLFYPAIVAEVGFGEARTYKIRFRIAPFATTVNDEGFEKLTVDKRLQFGLSFAGFL